MDSYSNQQNAFWSEIIMNAINIASFMIGLQNLELNVTAQDLNEQGDRILKEIHSHLATQDEHLTLQDQHLAEQDKRLDLIERYIETVIADATGSRKEINENG